MRYLSILALLAVAACGPAGRARDAVTVFFAPAAPQAPATAQNPDSGPSAADRLRDAADPAPVGGTGDASEPLRTVAGLGDPGRPGLWLETPLVRREGTGRIVVPGTGQAVRVSLIPAGGPQTAGSRLSLEAYRSLQAPLTQLIELEVYPGG